MRKIKSEWEEVMETPSTGAEVLRVGELVLNLVMFALAVFGAGGLVLSGGMSRGLAIAALAGLTAHLLGTLGGYEAVRARLKLRAYIRKGASQG